MTSAENTSGETVRLKRLHAIKVLDTQPEERFDRITRLARDVFRVPIALVTLVDSDRQWFKSRVGLEVPETPRSISFCGHAIQRPGVFVVENATVDQRFSHNPLVTGQPNIRFYAGYPLTTPSGERLGTLCIIDREPRPFSEEDARTLTSLGQMVEAELFTTTLATTDELTGLVNRRGFTTLATHVLALCRRHQTPASLALFDLNGFKRMNDELGHAEGDRALMQFASALVKGCRDSDIVARLGGDEFCALLSDTPLDEATSVVSRVRVQVLEINAKRDSRYPITFAVGTVAADVATTVDEVLAAGDSAMYADKRRRRADRRPGPRRP